VRPLAHGKALEARRATGERVGLVVVAIHDWNDGRWFESRTEVARVVLPADLQVQDANWAPFLALDCLVTGGDDATFYAVCAALADHGAASVWGAFADGFHRLERGHSLWHAVDGPFPPEKLGAALRQYRALATVLSHGFYRSRIFDGVRENLRREMVEALVE
jgi:hypothetical protein